MNLINYSGPARSVVVRDSLQGGVFNYVASGLTLDSCTVFPADSIGAGTGFWQRQRTQSGVWLADWWGITRNGHKQSMLMQQAINYIGRRGGGTLQLTSGGKYNASVLIRDNVHIVGGAYDGFTFHNVGADTTKYDVSWRCPEAGGYCIATAAAPDSGTTLCAVSTASVSGISFIGRGKNVPAIGIHLISWRRGQITNCSFYDFADQAVLQDLPGPGQRSGAITFRNIFVNNCCLNDTVDIATHKAVFDLQGSDDILDNVLLSCLSASGGSVIPSPNGNIYDLYLNNGDAYVINSAFQFADVGVYIGNLTEKLQFTNNKTDNTSRQGIVVDGGFDNQFVNNVINRPCQEANNTYNAFDLINNPHDNKILGLHLLSQGGNGNTAKYAVSESFTTSSADNKNEVAFITAQTTDYGTGIFYSQYINGSYFNGNENVQVDGSATPNVSGYNLIEANSGTTISNFIGGTPSQVIYVWFETSATVQNNGNISLALGANFTYPLNSVVGFRNLLGKWYEIGNFSSSALSAGTGITFTSGAVNNNLSTGVASSSQSVIGSTLSAGNLALQSTTNATKGSFTFDGTDAINGSTGQFGLGLTTPLADIDVNINPTAAFTSNGTIFRTRSLTQTDNTTPDTTLTNVNGSFFGPVTFAAANAIAVTNLANVQFALPVLGTNVTATNLITASFAGPFRVTTFGAGVLHTSSNGIASVSLVTSADLASTLSLPGTPTAPTAASTTNNTQIATTAFVKAVSYQHTSFAPTSGGSVTLVDHQYNIIAPSGGFSGLTFIMPASPVSGDVVMIKFTQTISGISWPGTVIGEPSTITAGTLVTLLFDGTNWY